MDFLEERIFMGVYENIKNDKEYKMYMYKAIELGYEIKEHLGPNSSLFLEYESLINLAEAIYLEEAYKTGLQDGHDLFQLMNS
ncbi:hypothetical protein [Desulfosporosinus sp. FKB]|uniref:hypothetical protein n=1 Tax=Desulfosporosinus sp. FKB TaxID=1969835 RepID=UPI000B4A0844|nr:hypothetical protein [Desulfosporosinus sp. FKB]